MSNRADRRRMMREQTAKSAQLLASYTRQQRIDNLMQQGISPAQLEQEYEKGRRDGFEQGALTMRKTCYGALCLALHELHGFGSERLFKVLDAVNTKVYFCLDNQDMIDELAAKTGLRLNIAEFINKLETEGSV